VHDRVTMMNGEQKVFKKSHSREEREKVEDHSTCLSLSHS